MRGNPEELIGVVFLPRSEPVEEGGKRFRVDIRVDQVVGPGDIGLALQLDAKGYDTIKYIVAVVSLLISMFFAWRSFYGMRITAAGPTAESIQKERDAK